MDPTVNRTYIITKLVNGTKYTLTNWEVIREDINLGVPLNILFDILEVVHTINAIQGVIIGGLLVGMTFYLVVTTIGQISEILGGITFFKKMIDFKRIWTPFFHRVEHGFVVNKFFQNWGPTLAKASKGIAYIDIVLGGIYIISGVLLIREGFHYSGGLMIFQGILLAVSGILVLLGPWGALAALVLTIIAFAICETIIWWIFNTPTS